MKKRDESVLGVLWAMGMFLLVSGCAGTQPEKPPVKPVPQFLSLSPESLGRSLSLSQLIIGEYGGRSYKVRVEVDVTPERLAMVGLSPLGITLFTLIHDQGRPAVISNNVGQARFDPRNVLFDLYLTYWPISVLKMALEPLSLTIEEGTETAKRRIFRQDGFLVAEVVFPPIDRKGEEIVIQHFDFPYRVRIRTLEERPRR